MPSGIYIRTKEHNRKLSEIGLKNPVRYWLGKKRSEEYKRKVSEAMKGRKLSKKHRINLSISRKGLIPWNKGKTGIYSETTLKKLRGENHKPKFHTQETKDKIRLARLKQKLPTIDTSIERKFEAYLKEKKINYVHPFNLGDKFQCDFYLPFLNLIVECDGTYWHSRPDMKKRDKAKNAYAKKCGFNMLRLTEEQINQGRFFL